jgi:putative oxidoreductase
VRNFYFQFLSRSSISRWAPLPLRLLVGYGFVQHGVAKLMKGPDTFAAILHAIGVPAPHFMAWLTILTELTGGIAVLLGAFIPLVSVPLAAVLLVAIFSVHLQYGFSSIRLIAITPAGAQFGPVGYETNLLYLAALLTLTIGGSGPLAIDRRLGTGEGRMKSRNPCLPTPSNPSSPPPPPTRADETDTRRQPTTPLA